MRYFALTLIALNPFFALAAERGMISSGVQIQSIGAPRAFIGVDYYGTGDEADTTHFFSVSGYIGFSRDGGVTPSLEIEVVPVRFDEIDSGSLHFLKTTLSRFVDLGLSGRATVYATSIELDPGEIELTEDARLYLNAVVDLVGASLIRFESESRSRWNAEWFGFKLECGAELDLSQDRYSIRLDLGGSIALPTTPADIWARLTYRFEKSGVGIFLEGGQLFELGGASLLWANVSGSKRF